MSVAESTAHVISSLSKETVRTLIGGGGRYDHYDQQGPI